MEARDLYTAMFTKAGYEVVGETPSENQLRIIGRVPKEKMPTWLSMVQSFLHRSEQAPWSVDVSKQYFLRGNKLLFGWRLIFQGENVIQYLPDMIQCVQRVRVVQQETMEVALHGNANRNALKRGKGAQPSGKAVVGPMAMMQERQGG